MTHPTQAPLATLEQIAAKHLHIDTLRQRNADSLDFHDLAVWSIHDALQAAYAVGAQAAQSPAPSRGPITLASLNAVIANAETAQA